MAKITVKDPSPKTKVIQAKTRDASQLVNQGYKWWKAGSKKDMAEQIVATAGFLKEQQQYRYRQAATYARLYSNKTIFNFLGAKFTNPSAQAGGLPIDRPTMNVIQSCIDTLTSRITQSKPRPVFLTDNGDYKERSLAEQMNKFIAGELYQTKAYQMGELLLRDACILGTGAAKIYTTADNKVALDRTLIPELLVDPNDAYYGNPRQLFQFKLVDKAYLAEIFPEHRSDIQKAEQGFPDNSSDSARTISDQIIIVEAWHLPSSPTAGDGYHAIACTSGIIAAEEYTKPSFPFIFLHYSPPITGFWGQGLSEQLMGTQVEINKIMMTISRSINLIGVPRVFVEDGSKVVKSHLNNEVGAIVTYRGTPPSYQVAPSNAPEIYEERQRLIQFAYQQSGISALAATSQKPSGLNSGEAIRNYDDLQTDRFASLAKRYDNLFIDAAYGIIDEAKKIVDLTGSYQTVYPNKDGVKEIDLPATKMLTDDPFVIQCFDASSLPREPAGRLQKITEMMQANLVSPQEGRRLLDFPDIEQVDKLANAAEERILKILDQIVEEGVYTPPDPFMDLNLATTLCTQYYNLYEGKKLEESKAQKLRNFFTQLQALKQAALPPPPPPGMPQGGPQAVPAKRPVSDTLPQVPGGQMPQGQ